jgi:hypothetical protein
MAERPQFTGVAPAGLVKQVFVDAGQPGGRQIPGGLGLLSNKPISSTPSAPRGPVCRPFSTELSPEIRGRIAAVESRKR